MLAQPAPKVGVKPWEELTFRDDYMFKRVMRNEHYCKKMLEMILRIRIRRIAYLEEEKALDGTYDSKSIRMDVYVEDDENTVFNVEMQVRNLKGGLFMRMRYYQSMLDTDLLMRGIPYKKLNRTFIIFICPFAVLDGKRHLYTFKNICMEDRNLELPDGATKVILSTKGTMDDVPPDTKAFLDYVDGVLSDDEFVTEIDQAIKRLKEQESERMSYMTYAMKLQEEREEGREEGREEANLSALRNLMANGSMTAAKAMELIGIPLESRDAYLAML